MKGYIYRIQNKVNGKVYIGQTRRKPNTRFSEHKRAKDNLPIHRALSKYGIDNFKFEVIKEIEENNKKDLVENLNKLEIDYITKYNSKVPNGYNIKEGGSNFVLNPTVPYNQEPIFDNGIIYNNMSEYCYSKSLSELDAYNILMFNFTSSLHWVNTQIKFEGCCYPENSTIQDILDNKAIRYIELPNILSYEHKLLLLIKILEEENRLLKLELENKA